MLCFATEKLALLERTADTATLTKSPSDTYAVPWTRVTIADVIVTDVQYGTALNYGVPIFNCCTLSFTSSSQWKLTTTKANVVVDGTARASGYSVSWNQNADVTHTIKKP